MKGKIESNAMEVGASNKSKTTEAKKKKKKKHVTKFEI